MSSPENTLVTLEFCTSSRSASSGEIAIVTLRNPPLNLITYQLLSELESTVIALEETSARAVVISQGEARVFSAGSDMREFTSLAAEGADRKILLENQVLGQIAALAMPVVAAIEGAALGGGLELALACDLRVATRSALVGLPEVSVGGLASNGTQRLTKIVGPGRAKHLLLTGEAISAATAEQWGVVTELVDDGEALHRAVRIAEIIADRAPRSVHWSKKLVDRAVDLSLAEGLKGSIEVQRKIFESPDLIEGAAAFAERRPPRFTGA